MGDKVIPQLENGGPSSYSDWMSFGINFKTVLMMFVTFFHFIDTVKKILYKITSPHSFKFFHRPGMFFAHIRR